MKKIFPLSLSVGVISWLVWFALSIVWSEVNHSGNHPGISNILLGLIIGWLAVMLYDIYRALLLDIRPQ